MEVTKEVNGILRRFETLKAERKNFEPLWREAEWNVAPVLQKWEDEKPKDGYEIPKRITNRPTQFLNTCMTGILGYGMSPNINWFRLSLADRDLNEEDGVAQWLEKCEKVLRRAMEISGLYQQAQRWVYEAVIYGHSAMLIEPLRGADKPVRYYTPCAHEFYLDQNETGETDTVFRAYYSDIENLVGYYGLKAMHERIREKYRRYVEKTESGYYTGAGQEMAVKLLHATFVRRTGKPDHGETAANKKWASYVIDLDNKHVIRESGYDDFPYAVFFWEKTGKPYGISPSIKAGNDIAMFQAASEALAEIQQGIARPHYIMPEQLRGKENFRPGGITYIDNPGITIPQQLERPGGLPETLETLRFYEQAVKDWFNVDFFLMLRQQGITAEMTATAIAAMQGEQTALLSAIIANLFDGQSTIIRRTFDILARKRLLPPMPFALRVAGGSLKVDYTGVLAQAQKAAYEYAGLQNVLGIASQYAQFAKVDPRFARVLDWLKVDALFKKTVESLGVPKEVIRTSEEYAEVQAGIDEQEKAQAAEQAEAANRQALMQNAQNLNQRVQSGSMLEGLLSPRQKPPKQGAF
jgi:hypothetical protein